MKELVAGQAAGRNEPEAATRGELEVNGVLDFEIKIEFISWQ